MVDTTNKAFWAISISAPITDQANGNLADVTITYSFNDGQGQAFQSVDTFKQVLGVNGLMNLILTNFVTHQQYADTMINTPVGNISMANLFPAQAVAPALTN